MHGALFTLSRVDEPLEHIVLRSYLVRRYEHIRPWATHRLSFPFLASLVLQALLNHRAKVFLTAPDTLRHVCEETPCDPDERKD